MAAHSSTSNSDSTAEFHGVRDNPPWAFLVALAVIALIEVSLRFAPLDALIPYTTGIVEYESAAHYVQDIAPADICIIGSSRAREAIMSPEVKSHVLLHDGRDVNVANYACPDARAHDCLAIARNLIREGPPETIIYGVTARQLLDPVGDMRRQEVIFWTWHDWLQLAETDLAAAMRTLPWKAHWSLDRNIRLLRYRKKMSTIVGDVVIARRCRATHAPSAMDIITGRAFARPTRGEQSRWHDTRSHVSLVSRPLTKERAANYIEALLVDGVYVLSEAQWSNVESIILLAQEAGVELVFAEAPIAPILQHEYPPGVLDAFRSRMRSLAAEHDIQFIESAPFELGLTDADYLDYSHLNRAGAEQYTRWLMSEKN
ncbi:MAG: hypothetical protein AAF432_10330 [Planctomycetota bacterium]